MCVTGGGVCGSRCGIHVQVCVCVCVCVTGGGVCGSRCGIHVQVCVCMCVGGCKWNMFTCGKLAMQCKAGQSKMNKVNF